MLGVGSVGIEAGFGDCFRSTGWGLLGKHAFRTTGTSSAVRLHGVGWRFLCKDRFAGVGGQCLGLALCGAALGAVWHMVTPSVQVEAAEPPYGHLKGGPLARMPALRRATI